MLTAIFSYTPRLSMDPVLGCFFALQKAGGAVFGKTGLSLQRMLAGQFREMKEQNCRYRRVNTVATILTDHLIYGR
jgi:hypothetical protein